MIDYREEVRLAKRQLNALLQRQATGKKDIWLGLGIMFVGFLIICWSLDVNFWVAPILPLTAGGGFVMLWGLVFVWGGFINSDWPIAVALTKFFGKKTLSAEIWECKMRIIELEGMAERQQRRKEQNENAGDSMF